MNTKHFDYFIVIAETKNLSKASEQLKVSQPVLSRYLADLERRLGIRLFVQENRSFHITAAGEIYLNGVKRMKDLQTQMQRSFNAARGIRETALCIGLSPYRGGREIASFAPHLFARYPNLDLRVTEGHSRYLLQCLYERKISSLINLYHPDYMPRTKIASFLRSELLLAVPDFHPLAAYGSPSPAEPAPLTTRQLSRLTDISFVYLNSDTVLGYMADAACSRYGFTPRTLMRTVNSIAVSSLLATGSYAGFLLQNTAQGMNHMRFFHFPHPQYLYSGMIFREDYRPSGAEIYLYQLEFLQEQRTNPHILYQNDLGKRLLAEEAE